MVNPNAAIKSTTCELLKGHCSMRELLSLFFVFAVPWVVPQHTSVVAQQGSFVGIGIFGELLSYDVETGDISVIGFTGIEDAFGLTYDPMSERLLAASSNTLFEVDPETAVATELATLVGSSGPVDQVSGLAFDSSTNTLFGVELNFNEPGSRNQLIEIDPGTGNVEAVGPLFSQNQNVTGLEYDPFRNLLFASLETTSELFTTDLVDGVRTLELSPEVGLSGLAIDTLSGDAFGIGLPGNLSSIDLQTGTTVPIGTGDFVGFGALSIAFVPSAIPEPVTTTVLGFGVCASALLRRRRKRDAFAWTSKNEV